MPELKPWVTGMLASMFSDLDSLTSEDGDVMARIAVSDTTGSLLQDRYVLSGRGYRALQLIIMFQYHAQHRASDARRESGKDNLHDSIPFRDFQVIKTSSRELVVDLSASDRNGGHQSIFPQTTTSSTSA